MVNLLMPSASVIKLLSNPWIPINALAFDLGINQNSQVANQLNNLTLSINCYLIHDNEQEWHNNDTVSAELGNN